jgi:hypothetical protein
VTVFPQESVAVHVLWRGTVGEQNPFAGTVEYVTATDPLHASVAVMVGMLGMASQVLKE